MSIRPKAKSGDVVPPQKDETPQPSFQLKHLLEQDRLWDRVRLSYKGSDACAGAA